MRKKQFQTLRKQQKTNNTLIVEQSDLTVKINFRGNYVKVKKYYLIIFQQIIDSLWSNNY